MLAALSQGGNQGPAVFPDTFEPILRDSTFPPGHWLEARRWDTPTFTAMYVDHERDYPVSGDWLSHKLHYFDLSLSGRPTGSRGYFPELFTDYHKLGRLFFVPAGHIYHGESGSGRQQNFYVFLRPQNPRRAPQKFEDNLAAVMRNCMDLRSDTIKSILLRMWRELSEPGFASELLLKGLGTTLLAETVRLLHDLSKSIARKGGLSPWRMKAIGDSASNAEPMPSLDHLAELCGLSRRQLMRAFREETGRTIGAYVQQTAVERAKALLRASNEPIAAIARRLGYANPAAFSTAFRRFTGASPRAYRSLGPTPRERTTP